MAQSSPASAPDRLYAVASRKAAGHLMPLLCIAYFMAFIDRTNVGLAKTALAADVGVSAAAYGLGAGIFFITYALFEVPSNLIMHRVGPRTWITRIAITWGLLTACMMFVQGPWSFYLVRVLLGAAEAGLFPAMMYIVTVWFAQSQRATMVGLIYFGACFAIALGGPIGGGLMELEGAGGLHGWQWMFLVEGVLAVVVGFLVWRLLPNRPSDARWLDADEAAALAERSTVPTAAAHTTLKGNIKVAFGRPFIVALALVYFVNQISSVAVQYNFPSIVEALNVSDPFLIGLISGSVGVAALLGVIVLPRIQRRVRNDVKVVVWCSVATAISGLAYVVVSNAVLEVLLIDLAMFFLIGVLPIYWAIAQGRMSGLMAAAGLAFINMVGLIGGFVGPYLYGWVEGSWNATASAYVVILGASVLGLVLLPWLHAAVRAEDRATGADALAEPEVVGRSGADR